MTRNREKHLESFGPSRLYFTVIVLVQNNPHLWRKVSNLLNNLRLRMRVWPHIDRENQRRSSLAYTKKAFQDTKFPPHVKEALKLAIEAEFNFDLSDV